MNLAESRKLGARQNLVEIAEVSWREAVVGTVDQS